MSDESPKPSSGFKSKIVKLWDKLRGFLGRMAKPCLQHKLNFTVFLILPLAFVIFLSCGGYGWLKRSLTKPPVAAQKSDEAKPEVKPELAKVEPELAKVEGSFREYLAERDAKLKKVLEETKAQEDRQKAQEERFYGSSQ